VTPGRKALTLLALGVLLGGAIWLTSPWLTGKAEPWDADAPIWTLSWLLVAVLGGLAGHVRGACLPLGYALGQVLYTAPALRTAEFGALGWLFIGAYAGVAVLGTIALVGLLAAVRRLWRASGGTSDGV
jgi:hypothetical protein